MNGTALYKSSNPILRSPIHQPGNSQPRTYNLPHNMRRSEKDICGSTYRAAYPIPFRDVDMLRNTFYLPCVERWDSEKAAWVPFWSGPHPPPASIIHPGPGRFAWASVLPHSGYDQPCQPSAPYCSSIQSTNNIG